MKLLSLDLHGTPIRDLSPLKGMPLHTLRLEGCGNLHDLSPLLECRQLQRLTITRSATNLIVLRDLPGLKRIGYIVANNQDVSWEQLPNPTNFWNAYDTLRR
jgi:Leucine-rich repeat (LRR) protein